MSLQIVLDRVAVTLDDSALLGVGGEGRVFRVGDRAVKIYHRIAPGLARGASQTQAVGAHLALEKVRAFPKMPNEVVAPDAIVTDLRGEPVGIAMPLVVGGVEAARLAQRRYREGVVPQGDVLACFARVAHVIEGIHAASVVVGDLNDGNVLFVNGAPRFIDADSMQFGPYPCVVGHERYLDPALYGVDLRRAPAFTQETDWYAFAVMLFTSLLYVHPYGGSHPSFKTVLRRAEAHHSALRGDVVYPRAGIRPETLSDTLLAWFSRVFDFGGRDAPPTDAFSASFTTCACGVEHARRACPACAIHVAVPAQMHAGGVQVTRIVTPVGSVVAVAVQGNLKFLVATEGALVRETGEVQRGARASAGTRFYLSCGTTWVAEGPRISRFERGAREATTSTSLFQAEPAFACNATDAFRTDGDWLVSATTGRRIGQVLSGQTFFRVGDELGFGFYRTGLLMRFFTFATARGGFHAVDLPPLRGRIVAAEVYFDAGLALFAVTTEERGALAASLHLVAADGRVVASMTGAPEDHVALATVHGKCLAFGVVLVAHDEGLLAMKPHATTRTFVPAREFRQARGHVTSESELFVGPGGSLYVRGPREILQLSIS